MHDRVCLNHPDRPAVAACDNCHEPLCSSCVETSVDGQFCSAACHHQAIQFQDRRVPESDGSGLLGMFLQLMVAAAVILGLVYAAARWGGFGWARTALSWIGIQV
jgi:hypothetical protein